MKKFVLLLCSIFWYSQFCSAQISQQTLRGTILDTDNKLPLAGVSVSIELGNTSFQAITDAEGNFRFEQMRIGRYTLTASFIGYDKLILPNLVLTAGKELVVSLSMQEAAHTLKEFVLTVDKNKGQAGNELALVSSRAVSPEQTNRFAGGFNDPSRILSNFAGVTNTQDGSNDIIVRGNSPKYLQWRLEGIQIANPNHFSDQSSVGGSISTLNNNLLASSDFYTAAFPAEFGDALSGVYDVKLRQGNNEKFESIAGLGVTGTDLTLEGPFKKGYKGSFLINYRYSTISLLDKLGLFNDINGVLNFQDAAFKIVLPTKKWGNFSLFGLGGISQFRFNDVNPALWQTPGNRYAPNKTGEDFLKKSHQLNLGLNHTITLSQKTHITSSLAYSSEGIDDEVFESFLYKVYDENGSYVKDSIRKDQLNFDGRVKKSTYRAELTVFHKFNAKHKIQAGSKLGLHQFDFRQSMFKDSTNKRFTLVDFSEDLLTIRNFINWKFRINEAFSTVAGIHNMNVLLNKQSTIEPRFAINWKPDRNVVWSLGYGNHSAMESIHHYFTRVEDAAGNITEPNRKLGLLKAHHFVLGYEKKLSKNLLLKLEAYYQGLYNLPVANSDTNSFSTINEGLDFQFIELVNKGTGQNYGIEFTLERFFSRNFYYLVNASVYNSTYKALDGIKRNTRFNGNYLVNALFGKEFPKLGSKQNKTFAINSRIFVGGGKKIIPLLRDGAGNLAVDPRNNRYLDFSKAYKNGLDDIYHLTISFSYKIDMRSTTHEIFLNIDNITNNRARLTEFYDPSAVGSVGYMRQSAAFPNLLYRIYF
ncbi:TonB-dependent receptor [Flavihumibacter sp. CACIAM 22H1]|uniref:TonB-dependent receptor n=1 Tax=Flavihumibacter sp. CACIAM 22H1 TaxID=1812911 RepID=UPI0007A9355D|nr:TonB-dependent receptor [Flavihumibacter sp. CACIAM 22H1]KYP13609.1 MAG: TonB-dependent receptor [Flavihumibacter sp. CACIAM 22H1]